MNPFYYALIGYLLALINIAVFINRLRTINKKLDLYLILLSTLNFFCGFFLLAFADSLQKMSIAITSQLNAHQLNMSGRIMILSSSIISAFVALWAIFRISQKKVKKNNS